MLSKALIAEIRKGRDANWVVALCDQAEAAIDLLAACEWAAQWFHGADKIILTAVIAKANSEHNACHPCQLNSDRSELLLDLWEYGTGELFEDINEEYCAAESERLAELYRRVSKALAELEESQKHA